MVIAIFSAFVVGAASLSLLRFARRRRLAELAMGDRQILPANSDDWLSVPTFIAGRPLRLSLSSEISSPVALTRSEICLPSETFSRLTSSQRRSILAHEVAHLERRDPEWMLFGQLVASALVVQPLSHLVVGRMRRDAEFICDDKAASGQAGPRALAESLAILARRFDPLASAVLGSHYASSSIVERAERLLGSQTGLGTSRAPRREWTTVAAIAACALLAASPALTLATSEPQRHNDAPPSSSRPMIVTDEREVLLSSHSLNFRR
jgi:beta-lactamase regulating signal transducer with metallopeptidase domain